jgi:hypothetical protein
MLLCSMDSDLQAATTKSQKPRKGINALLRDLSDDEDAPASTTPGISEDPERPWALCFHAYVDAPEQVPEGWSAIKWWGVSLQAVQDSSVRRFWTTNCYLL